MQHMKLAIRALLHPPGQTPGDAARARLTRLELKQRVGRRIPGERDIYTQMTVRIKTYIASHLNNLLVSVAFINANILVPKLS